MQAVGERLDHRPPLAPSICPIPLFDVLTYRILETPGQINAMVTGKQNAIAAYFMDCITQTGMVISLESRKHPLHQYGVVLQEQGHQMHRRGFIATKMNYKVVQITKTFRLLTSAFRHKSPAVFHIVWS